MPAPPRGRLRHVSNPHTLAERRATDLNGIWVGARVAEAASLSASGAAGAAFGTGQRDAGQPPLARRSLSGNGVWKGDRARAAAARLEGVGDAPRLEVWRHPDLRTDH